MSVTISKVDGVTMLTMTSDPDSLCPPLCQVLMGFCYSPLCYSVNRNMKRIQSKSLSVLGTLQFLIGLFHIGLGTILLCTGPGSWYQMDESFFPIWMGILFMVFGIMCVLMEKFPSPCLVFLHLVVHLCGAVFSIATIVLYSINLAHIRMWWMCREEHRYYYDATTMPSPAPQEETLLRQKCLVGKDLILVLLRSINAMLILLSVLELCVVVSAFVFGVKSIRSRGEKPKQGIEDLEQSKPLLQDDAALWPEPLQHHLDD